MARIPRKLAGIGATDLPDAAAFDAYVGPSREVTVDPSRGIIALHDGVTPGGIPIGGGEGGNSDPVGVYGLVASVSAGSLQISLKNAAGENPTIAEPVVLRFRSATAASGQPEDLEITTALSLTISSGSTLGIASATAFRIWIGIFNDGGTPRLAAKVCSDANAIYPLTDWQLQSAVAEGGAGGADSAGVMYSSAVITSRPFRILGYLDFSTGQATAGTWATNPDKIQIFEAGTPLPGTPLQAVKSTRTTQESFTSTTYVNSNVAVNITPQASPNKVALSVFSTAALGNSNVTGQLQIMRGGTPVGVGQSFFSSAVANFQTVAALIATDSPGSESSVTYTVAVKATAGLIYLPAAAIGEGVGATMVATEVMG